MNVYILLGLFKKQKNIKRKGRKEFTQRTQSCYFKAFILCVLCEKTLRLCGKRLFEQLHVLIQSTETGVPTFPHPPLREIKN